MAHVLRTMIISLALVFGAAPAAAQFSDSYNFLKAVRDRDVAKATEFLSKPGSVLVDTRDISNGETALHIVTKARDLPWVNLLLIRGAKADIRDRQGNTPLIVATRSRWVEGMTALVRNRAAVDGTNNSGETPLIVATQMRDPALVRFLLNQGANPDRKDTITGQSARDYAKADPRGAAILKIIEEPRAKPSAAPMQGPKL